MPSIEKRIGEILSRQDEERKQREREIATEREEYARQERSRRKGEIDLCRWLIDQSDAEKCFRELNQNFFKDRAVLVKNEGVHSCTHSTTGIDGEEDYYGYSLGFSSISLVLQKKRLFGTEEKDRIVLLAQAISQEEACIFVLFGRRAASGVCTHEPLFDIGALYRGGKGEDINRQPGPLKEKVFETIAEASAQILKTH